MYYYVRAITKYTEFKGRATRREFWIYELINAAIILILLVLHAVFQTGLPHTAMTYLVAAYALFQFVPSLSVTSRRWHDIGRTGKWVLLNIIPAAGTLVTLCYFLYRGDEGTNRYGRDPRERVSRRRLSYNE